MPKLHRRRRSGRSDPDPAPAPAVRARALHTPPGDQQTASPPETALAGYRLLRRLAASDRADVYLAVVDRPGGEHEGSAGGAPLVVMRVYGPSADDEAITTEIEAMEADRTGTLPRLIDVANVPDGRGCLVVERVSGRPLAEFLTAGGLEPGQVVTALAPIVVALRGLSDRGLVHARLAASDVLVDDSGRPRLLGLGALVRLDRRGSAADRIAASREGHAALLRLLEDAAAASTDRAAFAAVLDLARTALDARPFRRVDGEIERALFAVAPARPMLAAIDRPVDDTMPGLVATAIRGQAVVDDRFDSEPRIASGTPDQARIGRFAALAQLPPSAIDELAVTLDTDPRVRLVRRASEWARRRRPALVTGGLVGTAALVALLSAVPPSTADDRAVGGGAPAPPANGGGTRAENGADTAVSQGAGAGDGDAATRDEAAAPSPQVPDDPVAAAAALLEIRETCLAASDLDCVLAVDQPGSPIAVRDRAAIEGGEGVVASGADLDGIVVAADLGDAMVLTVPWTEAGREPASLLMMRSEAGWRLREWFD